jgi:hypothetical protein
MDFLFFENHKKICVYFLLGIVSDANAQLIHTHHFIDPYSINVTGAFIQQNNLHFDWSVGEVDNFKILSWQKKYQFSTGFLQSIYFPQLLFQQLDSFAMQIEVGPNPFSNKIIIQSSVGDIIINSIQLFDFQGHSLYISIEQFSGLQFYKEIIVKKLQVPICFLEIKYTISDRIYKSKYLKLIQH